MTRPVPVQSWIPDRPHGSRARYLAGCRCLLCRAANAEYRTDCYRAPETVQLVSAKRVRRHLQVLRRCGMGYREVARKAGVDPKHLRQIRSGDRHRIRATTEACVLGVESRKPLGALTPAAGTWQLIRRLQTKGFKLVDLARRLHPGRPVDHLRCGRRKVRISTAVQVRRFYEATMAEGEEFPRHPCGLCHQV